MSQVANQIHEITTAQFDELLKHQITRNGVTLKLTNFTLSNVKLVDTRDGKAMILTLLNHGDLWTQDHLKDKIMTGDTYANPPFSVRPLGLKPTKTNPKNKYHAYDLVIPE